MTRHRVTSRQTLALALGLLIATSASAELRNGKRFDPGREMTRRAEGAPSELDRVTGFVGQWDVEILIPRADGESVKAEGLSEITFMNRGHALMENFHSESYDGHDLAALHFFGFNPASKRWFLAGADSWDEHAWLADGEFAADALVFSDVRRLRGGLTATKFRYRFEQPATDSLRVKIESSTDGGATFSEIERRSYSRRQTSADFLTPASTHGSPAPGRLPEASEFDFLIGDWKAAHDMTFPNGQTAQWTSTNTGVYALNGSAVMEYNWFDVDPNLPDAATTILRLYNRGMRRWESLFIPNRGHTVLLFGGVREGSDIVLHPFAAGAAGTLSRWVFHSIEKDAYHWYAESSSDRGETWTKTWLIDVERQPPEAPLADRPETNPTGSPRARGRPTSAPVTCPSAKLSGIRGKLCPRASPAASLRAQNKMRVKIEDRKDGREFAGARLRTRIAVGALLLSMLPAAAVPGVAQQSEPTREVVALAEPCLDLHSGPSTTGPSLGCLPQGRRMVVLESSEDWLRVRLSNGQEGWVSGEQVGPPTAPAEGSTSGPPGQDLEPFAAEAGNRELEDKTSSLQNELAQLRDDNQRLTASLGASGRVKAAVQQQLAARQEALTATQAGYKELEEQTTVLRTELAELRGDNQQLTASVEAGVRAEAEAQQQLSARQEALASAQAGYKELEERATAFQNELTELRDDNQRLAASVEASEKAEAEALRRLSETEDALAAAQEEAAVAVAEKLELDTRIDTLESETTIERERIVDDYDARLGAAEIFLSESEAKRREAAEQLEALRLENESLRTPLQPEANDETAAAEPTESTGPGPSVQPPEMEPREISQPEAEADNQEPMAAVEAWARAWSEQRAGDYLSFYSRTFEPQGGANRAEWEAERRQRIARPSRIEVRVALIDLRRDNANRAEIEFLQSYDSDSFSDTIVKTLELVREEGAWKIAAELVD